MAFNADQALFGGVQAYDRRVPHDVSCQNKAHKTWPGAALEPVLAMGSRIFRTCAARHVSNERP